MENRGDMGPRKDAGMTPLFAGMPVTHEAAELFPAPG